jgi:hypothetical protein
MSVALQAAMSDLRHVTLGLELDGVAGILALGDHVEILYAMCKCFADYSAVLTVDEVRSLAALCISPDADLGPLGEDEEESMLVLYPIVVSVIAIRGLPEFFRFSGDIDNWGVAFTGGFVDVYGVAYNLCLRFNPNGNHYDARIQL